MGQTLTNGLYLPGEGERYCYDGLASNWTILDAVVGGYNAHIENTTIHISSEERIKWNTGVTQAYVLRYASSSVSANSTVAYSSLDNVDNVKIGDKVLDQDGKMYSVTAVDSANSRITVGSLLIDLSKDSDLSNYYTKTETDTLLSDKADDSAVVHKRGDETVNGIKNFKHMIPIDGDYLGNESSGNARTNICLRSNKDTVGKSGIYISKFRPNKAQGSMGTNDVVYISFDVLENEVRTNNTMGIQCSGWVDDIPTKVKIISTIDDSTFGSSTRPSKINDLEPSALGSPDLNNGIDISGYINVGDVDNTYTPPANGWIWIRLIGNGAGIIQGDFGINASYVTNNVNNQKWVETNLFVTKNIQATIRCRGITGLVSAKFYPCQGNI